MPELFDRVEKALDSVRPYLNRDGGDVKIVTIENDTVTIEFEGNCSSCSMSNMTLKAGIEESIIKAVPEIKQVRALNLPIK